MFRYVDVGTELFAMASTLSMAERMIADNPADTSPQELSDLFCRGARRRIADHFRRVRKNHNDVIKQVSRGVLEGRYDWIETDIVREGPIIAQAADIKPAPQPRAKTDAA